MKEYRFEPLGLRGTTRRRDLFASGVDALDRYLRDTASQDMRRGFAHVVVAVRPDHPDILGYYAFSAASADLTGLPDETRRKMPRYGQVPSVLLGRLAVDSKEQGNGLGALLLADAVKRALGSELAWALFLVRAKDERAVAFYRHFGFQALAGDPLLLWLTRRQAETVVL